MTRGYRRIGCLVGILGAGGLWFHVPVALAAGRTSLAEAAQRGDLPAVRLLLNQPGTPDDAGLDGTTALHYAVRLRPRLHSYRFRSPGQGLWWKGLDPQVFGGQWGGEVAAAQLGTVLKPEKAILYLQQGDMRLGLSQLIKSQALRSDPDGDVEVVEAFWENERLGWSGCCVPLPLVVADLQASQDARNIEAAVELKENWLRDVEA